MTPAPRRSPRPARSTTTPPSPAGETEGSFPVVHTPPRVRLLAAACLGIGIGALYLPISSTIAALLSCGFIMAGFLVDFAHPYRKDFHAALAERGRTSQISLRTWVALFPLWLLAMQIFIFPRSVSPLVSLAVAAAVGIAVAVYTYIRLPVINNTVLTATAQR